MDPGFFSAVLRSLHLWQLDFISPCSFLMEAVRPMNPQVSGGAPSSLGDHFLDPLPVFHEATLKSLQFQEVGL